MYDVRYNCTNCGQTFLKSFPKGTSAPYTVVCEKCGCKTAGKSWNEQTDKGWKIPYYEPIPIAPYRPPNPGPWYPSWPYRLTTPKPIDEGWYYISYDYNTMC